MEEKINIAKILKDKPEKTILYDTMRDINVSLYVVEKRNRETNIFCDGMEKFKGCSFVYSDTGADSIFRKGMQLLKPSKEMQDWEKFSWKKGDVLVCKDVNSHIIFEKFNDDTYTTFTGKLYYQATRAGYSYTHTRNLAMTQDFDIEEGDAVQTYIKTIEEKLGGKLNRETLEVEKAQHEFKNGDIAFADYGNRQDVFIVSDKTDLYEGYSSFISLDLRGLTLSMGYRTCFFKKNLCELRLATEEERQQLFKALANEGKAWDAEKKMIVGLKSLWTPKPFDKVLVRNSDADKWLAGFFEKFEKSWNNPYHIMNLHHMTDFAFKQCIPYEGNEHLLGITKDMEG